MRLLILFVFATTYGNVYGCSSNPSVKDDRPLVETSSGTIAGKYENVQEGEVAAFLGIPYAEPPINEKRFMKPCALRRWNGILEATEKPKPCMQFSSRDNTKYRWIPKTTPSEDCLYLNVWTPAECCCNLSERLPVIVWIFGGGFYAGSTDIELYDGSVMAAYGKAVIVSINYRLGIFGFLKSGSEEAPGNVGLLDQNLAMRWIKTNIENFGGDPNRITLMGESAGSWSVSLHTISPMSRNLFNRAIMQSGSSYHPLLVDSPQIAFGKATLYAQLLGCIKGNSTIETDPKVFGCIKSKTSEELAKVEDMFTSKLPQYFLPTYGDEFLPSPAIERFKDGHIAPVDILIGNNQNETTIFLNYISPLVFPLDGEPLLNEKVVESLLPNLFSTVQSPSANEIFKQYFQNASEAASHEITRIINDAFGDFVFNCPTQFFAEKAQNVYYYWMTHRSDKERSAEWVGVPHFYEIPYVFGVPLKDAATHTPINDATTIYTREDRQFSKDLIEKWVTFARTGHPLSGKNPENWTPFSAEVPVAYELSYERQGIITFPRAKACEFWRPFLNIVL